MKRPEITDEALYEMLSTMWPNGLYLEQLTSQIDFPALLDWIADNVEPHHVYPESYLKEYCMQYLGYDRG